MTATPSSEEQRIFSDLLELVLFDALRRHFARDMSVLDIVACREIVNNWLDEHPAHYDEIVGRLLDARLGSLPLHVWPQFIWEVREYGGFDDCTGNYNNNIDHATMMIQLGLEEKGEEKMRKFKLFRIEKDVYRAIANAYEKGFVEYKLSQCGIPDDHIIGVGEEEEGQQKKIISVPQVDVKLREAVFNVLENARLKEYEKHGLEFDATTTVASVVVAEEAEEEGGEEEEYDFDRNTIN